MVHSHDSSRIGGKFYTGTTQFLQANEYLVQALIEASRHTEVHASEDIFDAVGLKLWSRGQPIDDRLLERLMERPLRKPIELCVVARDPIGASTLEETIWRRCNENRELAELIGPQLPDLLNVVQTVGPNPVELLMLVTLRLGGRPMFDHAAVVAAIALAGALSQDSHPAGIYGLLRAALLHDVGELYLAPECFDTDGELSFDQWIQVRNHAVIGARVALELTGSGPNVAQLIACSHERLDGSGYPARLVAARLPDLAGPLIFAEAIAGIIEGQSNGLRRASVATRIFHGEFPQAQVNWVSRRLGGLAPHATDEDRNWLNHHMRCAVACVDRLLTEFGPAAQAQELLGPTSREWRERLEDLAKALRVTGVSEAISMGQDIAGDQAGETVELLALAGEVEFRLRQWQFGLAAVKESGEFPAAAELIDRVRGIYTEAYKSAAGPAVAEGAVPSGSP